MKLKNYINGKFVNAISNKTLNNFNPSTGEQIQKFPDSDVDDVNIAVKKAKEAFQIWKTKSIKYRSEFLINLGSEIKNNAEKIAIAESIDTGKPEWLSKDLDIPRAAENMFFFGNSIRHFFSEFHNMDNSAFNYTLRQPIGVVGCISPWNLPLYLLTWKIAPAIATGNTVVAKPSELTPYTAFIFSKLCEKINFPKGVINIVHGLGKTAGDAIVKHKDVPVITFTGGTETGKKITRNSASQLKKISLELGGKNPNIIFDDADLDIAIDTSVRASFLNQGQICLCGSRIYIQNNIYNKFKKQFLEKVNKMKVGDPTLNENDLGSVISKEHLNKILNYINIAKDEGGKILIGGKQVKIKGKYEKGFFIEPTVIEGLPVSSKVNQNEVFGPVVTLTPFSDEDDLLKLTNSTQYGLSASIFTQNLNRAHRLASLIDAGTVWINTWLLRDLRVPFGGMKKSGIGREGGHSSLHFFTEPKNICIKL